jgi:hypothetical protein
MARMTEPASRFREAYDAFAERGDLDPFAEMLDPDVEWVAWDGEVGCHSREEAMDVVRHALEKGANSLSEMPQFVGSGEKFVMIPRLRELPPFFPPDAEGLFQVVEMRKDKITRIQDFVRREDALAVAGLPS